MKLFIPREQDIYDIIARVGPELGYLAGKEVLITGAAGFLGRYFLHVISAHNKVSNEKIKVTGTDNFISSGLYGTEIETDHLECVKFLNVDVSRLSEDDLRLANDAEIIVHCAGIASPQQYKAQPLKTIDVAVSGTRSLLECCKDPAQRFVFFSSSEIYGNPPESEIPISEEFRGNVSSIGPRSCYDESKRLGETLCTVFSDLYDTHTNIIRPFNVYGPGMQRTDYRVMPNFAFRIKENLPIQVYGTGNQTRTYCYISDAIVGFIKVFARGRMRQAYNIGNPNQEISAFELAKTFRKICRSNTSIEIKKHPNEYPSDEPDRRCPSIQKAMTDLEYYPNVDLETGIKSFYEYIEESS